MPDFRPAGAAMDGLLDRLTAQALERTGCRDRAEAEQIIAAALALAEDFAAGRITITDVRRQSTPQERFLLRFVHPWPRSVHAMFDALVDSDATQPDGFAYRTKHGLVPASELPRELTRMDKTEDGQVRIRFASRWPWRRRPRDDDPGERAAPIFADGAEDRARFAAQRESPRAVRRDWDDE